MSCLAEDGPFSRPPQDGINSWAVSKGRCNGQGSSGCFRFRQQGGQWPVLSQKRQVQRRWQIGQGTRGTNPEEVLAKVQRLESAIEVWATESADRWLGAAFEESRRAAQEPPLAIQVEQCQAIKRFRNRLMRMEQERAAEQKELDAAQVRLTRLREEMMRASSLGPTQPAARSLTVPSPDMPRTSEQVWLCFSVREGTDLL